MNTSFKKPLEDNIFITGLVLVAFSALLLGLTTDASNGSSFGFFFINYSISTIYLLIVLVSNFAKYRWRLGKGQLRHTLLLLVLYFISAFALNREMNVFEDSVIWLSAWLIASSVIMVFAPFVSSSSARWLQYLFYFCLGAAFMLFVYYAIYLIPLYVISLVGILALGISIHTYIPLFLAIVCLILVIRSVRLNKRVLYPFLFGATIPIVVCGIFVIMWQSKTKEINVLINKNSLEETNLPSWIIVSQHVSPSFIAERILKSGLVYHEANFDDFMWSGMPSSSFDEKKKHDPLVVVATLFFKGSGLDEKERIKILKSIYRSRHQAEERLWSGDHLETSNVVTNIRLFPAHRMAYTEKTITIKNNAKSVWSNQEAIYTFHLTEGSVVSSLSLWIDGKEEKSRLTTKAKADSAYKTIVGVESRDPSVIHWQEGNTITLRVFPCTPKENRKFKIGVTSPMSKKQNQLIYQQIYFEGPSSASALESAMVSIVGRATDLQLPAQFKAQHNGSYRAEEINEPTWEISCTAPELSSSPFSFGESSYQLKNYQKKYRAFRASRVYLDLNATWTKSEFDDIYRSIKYGDIYVFNGRMVKLSPKNADELFERLHQQNFSIFPIQEIADPENALLVSKGSVGTPGLNDLNDTDFGKELTSYLSTPKQINLYHLGQIESPYLKALRELRVFNYDEGTPKRFVQLISSQKFVEPQENDRTIVIESAQMAIEKIAEGKTIAAPDHLLRLFAYNDIMKKVAPNYFNKSYIQPELIAEAEQAYIVTPISSMIVLETQKDYDRFDIETNKNSLKNASMKSSGAVPEPHEWILILLCVTIVTYLWLGRKNIPNYVSSTFKKI